MQGFESGSGDAGNRNPTSTDRLDTACQRLTLYIRCRAKFASDTAQNVMAQEAREEHCMIRTVFISFDYDRDRRYRYLLSALNQNRRSDLTFTDGTPREIQTDSISRVKAVLTTRINQATHTLVIVGQDANRLHTDHQEIGQRNWQHWEITQSAQAGNKFVGVKIDRNFDSPTPLLGQGAKWAMSFTVESIIAALEEA